MSYAKKMARKNRIPYTMARRIYLGDYSTYVEDTGKGTFSIISPSSSIKVRRNGSLLISGSKDITFGGSILDFTELPDRYIRPSGISWNWIANNTEVFGGLPISINGKKVYIPFIGSEVE